jgi:hypothetical protein
MAHRQANRLACAGDAQLPAAAGGGAGGHGLLTPSAAFQDGSVPLIVEINGCVLWLPEECLSTLANEISLVSDPPVYPDQCIEAAQQFLSALVGSGCLALPCHAETPPLDSQDLPAHRQSKPADA